MKAIVGRVLGMAMAFGLTGSPGAASAGEEPWIELIGDHGLVAWKAPTGNWSIAGNARPDPKNPKKLLAEPGKGVLVNGPTGKTTNLLTNERFANIEAHFEFVIPKGSNSGVKFEGLYEIQIFDSFGVAKPTGSQHGGIYPRAELLPKYRYLDEGVVPKVNASRPPGEWQTLDVIFLAPRFNAAGEKTRNARFAKVVLNGQVIHENVEVNTPTGHVWRTKESPSGPILLQADHGPVAFRNIRVRHHQTEEIEVLSH
jgi:hypothetical protein